jgi:polyphosphate kinase
VRHYPRVRDAMFVAADPGFAPWSVARSDDTKRSLLTIIRHLLAQVPYEDLPREKLKPRKRQNGGGDVEPDGSFKIRTLLTAWRGLTGLEGEWGR